MSQLYKVKVETDMMVVADNESAAIALAKENAPNEIHVYGKGAAQVVRSILDVPEDWKTVVPYSKGSTESRKCMDIVSSVHRELPKEDMETIIKIRAEATGSVEERPDIKPETRPDPKPKDMDWHETKSGRPMPSLRFIK